MNGRELYSASCSHPVHRLLIHKREFSQNKIFHILYVCLVSRLKAGITLQRISECINYSPDLLIPVGLLKI